MTDKTKNAENEEQQNIMNSDKYESTMQYPQGFLRESLTTEDVLSQL